MTNPTYTDEQVLDLIEVCREGPMQAAMWHMDVAKALEHLLADRQRLQAEAGASHRRGYSAEEIRAVYDHYLELNNGDVAKAQTDLGTWTLGNGAAMDYAMFAARATLNETKEAKS